MKKKFRILFLVLAGIAVGVFIYIQYPGTHGERSEIVETNGNGQYADTDITFEIIDGVDGTFGYNIFIDGRLVIRQPNIPALPGNEGFASGEDAQTVAEFVITKIRKNIFPPTISVEELDSLGVLKQ